MARWRRLCLPNRKFLISSRKSFKSTTEERRTGAARPTQGCCLRGFNDFPDSRIGGFKVSQLNFDKLNLSFGYRLFPERDENKMKTFISLLSLICFRIQFM